MIKAAVSKMPSTSWQRCVALKARLWRDVHFMRNVLAHAGKQGRRVISAFIATAFAQPARHGKLMRPAPPSIDACHPPVVTPHGGTRSS